MNVFKYRPELDEFEEQTREKASAGLCEGSCDSHFGKVSSYRVVAADGTDWGWFSYCESALKQDTERGFFLFDETPTH